MNLDPNTMMANLMYAAAVGGFASGFISQLAIGAALLVLLRHVIDVRLTPIEGEINCLKLRVEALEKAGHN